MVLTFAGCICSDYNYITEERISVLVGDEFIERSAENCADVVQR